MIDKGAIGNRFQNMDRAKDLYKKLSLYPLSVLTTEELELMKLNIEKRHVIGYNLSVADEAYADTKSREKPGTKVEILAEEIAEFAETIKNIIVELEQLMGFWICFKSHPTT